MTVGIAVNPGYELIAGAVRGKSGCTCLKADLRKRRFANKGTATCTIGYPRVVPCGEADDAAADLLIHARFSLQVVWIVLSEGMIPEAVCDFMAQDAREICKDDTRVSIMLIAGYVLGAASKRSRIAAAGILAANPGGILQCHPSHDRFRISHVFMAF